MSLYDTCIQLRSIIQEIEGAIAFNLPISGVANIGNRVQLTETWLNQISEVLNPPQP